MNSLELHILNTLATVSEASAEDFDHCNSTISLLLARDMISAELSDGVKRYRITEKGVARLEQELSGLGGIQASQASPEDDESVDKISSTSDPE